MKKTLKRFFRDKRAITPVLSNLLLTVVAVAAMSIATTATYVITTNLKEIMSERVIAEDLWFNNSTGISIYLRNVGKVAVHISSVYVNHTSQSFASPFDLEIDQHNWLNVSYIWTSGSTYYVDIVTTRGTHIADYYKAP
jgi:Flp pilus assembly pilin Flp